MTLRTIYLLDDKNLFGFDSLFFGSSAIFRRARCGDRAQQTNSASGHFEEHFEGILTKNLFMSRFNSPQAVAQIKVRHVRGFFEGWQPDIFLSGVFHNKCTNNTDSVWQIEPA